MRVFSTRIESVQRDPRDGQAGRSARDDGVNIKVAAGLDLREATGRRVSSIAAAYTAVKH